MRPRPGNFVPGVGRNGILTVLSKIGAYRAKTLPYGVLAGMVFSLSVFLRPGDGFLSGYDGWKQGPENRGKY
jgi:hypothetical protein